MSNILLNPLLVTSQINDQYIRKNFERLKQYFQTQNQLLNFAFFEQIFTEAHTGFKLAHGLNSIPMDIILTHVSGAGTVSFTYGAFDTTSLVMDVSGPCRIRFYAGTYPKSQSAVNFATSDIQVIAADPLTTTSKTKHTIQAIPLSGKDLNSFPGSTVQNYFVRAGIDDIVLIDTTLGGTTATLPLAAACPNELFTFKKKGSDTNNIVFQCQGSDLLDGSSSLTLSTARVKLVVFCDGNAFYRLV